MLRGDFGVHRVGGAFMHLWGIGYYLEVVSVDLSVCNT